MKMPFVTMMFGMILVALGVGVYVATNMASFTALIPAGFGALLVVIGGVACNPASRKHAMHFAVILALLGTLGGLGMGLPKLPAVLDGTHPRPAAIWSQIAMGAICVVFMVLCIRSFIAARRARQASIPM